MKKILILYMIVVILGVGCGESTDEIDGTKDTQSVTYLDSMASRIVAPGQSSQLGELGIPATYQSEYDNDETSMRLEIDAEVIRPEVESLSIYKVTSGNYDEVNLDYMLETCNTEQNRTDLTLVTYQYDYDIPSRSISFTEESFVENYIVIEPMLIIQSDDEVIYPLPEQLEGDFQMTSDEIEEVQYLLEKMGMTDLVFTSCTAKYASDTRDSQLNRIYELTFMRTYDEVKSLAINNINVDYTYQIDDEIWRDEQVQVILNEMGVQFIGFAEPYENVEVYLSEVNLLPYYSIMDLLEQILEIQDYSTKYLAYGSIENTSITYQVNEIELGMKKITDIRGEEGLVVPVWNFQGDVIVSNTEIKYSETFEDISIITINAVDGTVVQ